MADQVKEGRLQGGAGFWGVAAALNVIMIGATLQTPLYRRYQQRFGFDELVLTMIYSMYMAGTIVALVFFGRLSDQIGRRRVMLLGMGVAAAAVAIFLCTVDTAMLFVARALFGFAVGLTTATATAWLTELHPQNDRAYASLVASTDNLLGLGVGPLVAGLLAQYAVWPLRLVYLVYLVLLTTATLLFRAAPETVQSNKGVSLKPRLGVPRELLARFIPPATAVFAIYALSGLFSALTPTLLARLHETNSAVSGAVVLGYYLVGVATELALRSVRSHTAMLLGLAALLGSLFLVVLASPDRSLAILLTGILLGGVSLGLGFRGSLEVVNQIAPAERRAEILSTYFIVAYVGVAIPVIGVGVLSQLVSPPVANIVFGIGVGVLAIFAIITGLRYEPPEPP